ncbi:MAG: M14 family metallopeptidase [Bryobacteraceae bacterium]|nr:M14 family metallopeptidase [Bryobacteraceae bacterium]
MRLIAAALLAVALAAEVPTPQSHFGHPIGQDRTLLDWNKVVSYFGALQQNSNRIQVREIGRSVQGRPLIAAFLAAPQTLANLGRYQQIQKRLADPRRTPDTEAAKLIAEGKVVVMITCSIHATEVASTHTAVEFAYRFLTEDRPKFRQIYDNAIFILVPSLNPDGVDIVTQWYRKTLNTPYEGTSPPELYHAYTGHDNNRDWYIFSQPETRAVISQLHNTWHPQIVYDVHQQGQNASRMFVPPWMDPIDPNVDPVMAQSANMIGMGMAADLTAAGKKGVVVNALYDFWTPARHYQAYHGGMRILSESASAKLASPVTIAASEISRSAQGYDPHQRTWNYLEPWLGGDWRLRDIIEDQLIAWESCLWQAATRREDLLRNFHGILKRASERESPYSFILSRDQFDPGAAKRLLETLAFGMVEVERAASAFEADGRSYPAGSYVIRMQQPFSSFAKTLLERQEYPDLRLYPGGPPKRPYDVTAQTLPLLMGVAVDTAKDRFQTTLAPARQFEFQLSAAKPDGSLAASDVRSWREVNAAWNSGKPVARDSAGNFYIYRATGGGIKPLKRPRIALYKSHMPSMDEGWTRWAFDTFGFRYTRLGNAEILKGGLNRNYDVIVFPDQGPGAINNGYRPGAMPPELTGGLGDQGAAALKQFANNGGTLVFLNESTLFAVGHIGIGLKNSVRGLSNREFYSPGSLLNVTLDETHPLTRGLPKNIAIWSEGSPAWELPEGMRVIARYPKSDVLASGWLLGEKYIAGRAALVEAPMGEGRAILFGMRPQYRAQSWQTFKLLFNALTLP